MQFAEKINQGITLLIQNGHTETAQWMLEKLVVEYPNNAGAHHERAILAHKLSDTHTAAIHFKRAAELAPEDLMIQKSLGDFYHVAEGQTEKAIAQYKIVLNLNPFEIDTLLTTAHLYVSLRRFEEARGYYEKLLAIDPTQTEARQILSKLTTHQAKQVPKESPELLYQKACSQVEAGMQQEAIHSLETIITLDSKHALAHNDLGVLYYEVGDKQKSQTHYEQAAALEPENTTYLKNLADFYYIEQEDAQKAMQIYVQVLTLNPQDVECLMSTGYICMALGQNQDARVFFDRVLDIEPWNNQASGVMQQLDLQPVNHQLQSKPGTEEDLYLKAQNQSSDGDIAGAIRTLEQVIVREPNHAMAHNDLGVLFYEQGDKRQSLRYYELALGHNPENHTIMKNLADFYFIEQGRTEDALKIYIKILEVDPKDTDCLMAAGTICASLDRDGDARIFFERIMEIDPWHSQARQELDRIDNAPEKHFGSSIAAFGQKMAI